MSMDPIKRERAVDEWLEAALDQYGKVEPRAGLEGRVLSSLQAERTRVTAPSRWWWVTGMATALALIAAAIWVWQRGNEARRANTAGIANTTHHEVATIHPPESYPAKRVVTHTLRRGPIRIVAVAAAPKLDQFPSPRNLSKEESLLVRRLLVRGLADQPSTEALPEVTATGAEVDLSIDSLEIRPLQIPDIEISENQTN